MVETLYSMLYFIRVPTGARSGTKPEEMGRQAVPSDQITRPGSLLGCGMWEMRWAMMLTKAMNGEESLMMMVMMVKP